MVPKTGKTSMDDEAFIYIFAGLIVAFIIAWLWVVHHLGQATAELERLESSDSRDPDQPTKEIIL